EGTAPVHHRYRYEWTDDGTVRATTIEASAMTTGSIWELQLRPRPGSGSTVHIHVEMGFKGPMGALGKLMMLFNGGGAATYRTWWRSGRDSNSRTGYAGYGISSAAPSTRLGDRSAASRFYPPSARPERRPFPEGRPSRLNAALITERCVNACGKLPNISPVSGSNSSAKSPRSFAVSVTRLK